jgi:hypothetical protein
MYIEETGFYASKECHKTESLRNHTATAHNERERLGDRRNAGENSCNSGDGTGQMAQPLMFMIMMMRERHENSLSRKPDIVSTARISAVLSIMGLRRFITVLTGVCHLSHF